MKENAQSENPQTNQGDKSSLNRLSWKADVHNETTRAQHQTNALDAHPAALMMDRTGGGKNKKYSVKLALTAEKKFFFFCLD